MTVQLIVDADVCIGSGECVATDPEAIELDDTGCARVLIPQLEEGRATEICDACPVGALSIRR
jgi:ferredoxin